MLTVPICMSHREVAASGRSYGSPCAHSDSNAWLPFTSTLKCLDARHTYGKIVNPEKLDEEILG